MKTKSLAILNVSLILTPNLDYFGCLKTPFVPQQYMLK